MPQIHRSVSAFQVNFNSPKSGGFHHLCFVDEEAKTGQNPRSALRTWDLNFHHTLQLPLQFTKAASRVPAFVPARLPIPVPFTLEEARDGLRTWIPVSPLREAPMVSVSWLWYGSYLSVVGI